MRNIQPKGCGFQVIVRRNYTSIYCHTFRKLKDAIKARNKIESENRLTTIDDHFWTYVDRSNGPESCWEWKGSTVKGYGRFNTARGYFLAHRYSYEAAFGPIPANTLIDHICFNHKCVNPKHLRPASNMQNNEHRHGPNRNNRSSGIRGVTWDKNRKQWSVKVMHCYHCYNAGRFTSLHDAEQAAINLRNKLMTFNDLDRTQPTTK